ncbi:MAG: DUF6077 domain-containing protein [Cyanobacteria bacterium P01_G01_bin.38]
MKIFLTLLQIIIQFFASWTAAYHFSLLIRLPAKFTYVPFLCIVSIVLYLFYKDNLKSLKHHRFWPKGQGLSVLGTFFFCLLLGELTVFISRPNLDDFSYFHRVLVQLENLDQPFFLGDTSHNMAGLPALSLMHVMTSYEPLVGLLANWLGLDPLWVYQNLIGLIVAALFPITYILLYEQLGLSRYASLWAAIAASLFLLWDGNLHRSFGNFAFTRCWQGKGILITLLIPLAGLFCIRFLRYPSWRKFSLMAMVAISGVGLSGSGVFLIPLLIFAIAASYGIAFGNSWRRWKRSLIVCFAAFYPVGIAIAFNINLLPPPSNVSIWIDVWPNNWWQNILQLVIGDTETLVRNVLILLILPLMGLSQLNSRFLVGLSIVLSLMFVNPLLGPVWLSLIKPGAYWRLAYLFPLPLCAGLIVSPNIWRKIKHRAWLRGLRIGMATMIGLSFVQAYQLPALPHKDPPKADPIYWKMPGEYKLVKSDLAFAQMISDQVSNRSVLTSEPMVGVLGLINSTVRFEATRPVETIHIFRNFKNSESIGENRVTAQKTTQTCKPTAAFWQSLDNVDALIIHKCPQEDFDNFLEQLAEQMKGWKIANEGPKYTLFLSNKTRLDQ